MDKKQLQEFESLLDRFLLTGITVTQENAVFTIKAAASKQLFNILKQEKNETKTQKPQTSKP